MSTSPGAKRWGLSTLVIAFLVQTALVYSDQPTGPLDELALRGRTLWHRNGCQVCHQLYGQGGFLGPDLTNAHSRVDSVRLHSLLTNGSGQMPSFGFTDEQVAEMRAFLAALDRPELGRGQLRLGTAADAGPWDRFARVVTPMLEARSEAARGWQALASRPCDACHQPLIEAATGAPDLSRAAARLTQEELRTVLRTGRLDRGMPPPTPAFTPDEIDQVVSFLTWLAESRDSVAARFTDAAPERAVDWRRIPWWEYR